MVNFDGVKSLLTKSSVALMFNKNYDLVDMPNDEYCAVMRGKATRHEVAEELLKDPHHSGVNIAELDDLIPHIDKELFRSFKEHKISISQLKARVYKRRFKIDYTCFDDIKEDLDPKWLDEKEKEKFRPKMKMIFGDNYDPEELLRQLQPHEVNDKCLRSINWHVLH